MKYLLTFIYGILLLVVGVYVIYSHNDFYSFWDYICVILGIIIVISGFEKLDNATL